jgi:hypothetical protein
MSKSKYPVRGYFHSESAFNTISEWEEIAKKILILQRKGFSTRGGVISDNVELVDIIKKYYSYQLFIQTQQYDLLTQKNVLDHIEDFVNHRVWGMRKEFESVLPNISEVKIAFFYSRGDLEPYVLLNSAFTKYIYNDVNIPVTSKHWTNVNGFNNIKESIKNNYVYAISTFTKQEFGFFNPISNILMEIEGNLVAAFKSDVKSIVTTHGHRAANMYRLSYINETSNLITDLNAEETEIESGIWNEIIIKPTKIISAKKMHKY